MSQFKVKAHWLNVRDAADGDAAVIAEIPRNTVFTRDTTSTDGHWARIQAVLKGMPIVGWASTDPRWSAPYAAAAAPSEFSNARFSSARREAYIESVLGDPDKFNFLRQSRQAWGAGTWAHGFVDGGKHFRVSASWKESQNGRLKIVERTTEISADQFAKQFGGAGAATYCNFNISYCYSQAYGGSNLQDSNGTGAAGERSANMLMDFFKAHWRAVETPEAAAIANAGGFVVVAWKNPSGHGHVMFLTDGCDPGGDPDGLNCFHVGSGAPRRATVGKIFKDTKMLRYFVDPATHDEWHSAGDAPAALVAEAPKAEPFSIDTDLKARPSTATAEKIDAFLQKAAPGLAGIGAAVMAAAKKYGINPVYIVAHAWHETGKGTSNIYLKKNNLFGWGSFDATPFASSGKFPDRATCIDYVMGRIDALYLTPGAKYFRKRPCLGNDAYGMNVFYATDKKWGSKIARIAGIIEAGL
ncbi:MAG TPA: glucosaminidase domain-containing protein [Longimicrobium sp.]|jgi:flagellum-specific peptidoglycan hydrolase FlgJ